jgi:multidrug efflux system membrane fusion protein
MFAVTAVPGRFLSEIRRYHSQRPLSVTAASPDDSNPELSAAVTASGVVSFIDNSVDASTGTIRLKGSFVNADRQLWPGSFVRVVLNLTTQRDVVVVPATAVQTSQDGQFVYVVKADKTVDMRKVTVERQQGAEIVIAEGVAPGDIVVTDGHLRLTPGARVAEPAPGGREGAGGGGARGARGGAPAGRER